MGDKISVLSEIDLDGAYVRLIATGHLTETNQQGLHPLIQQARTLAPDGAISVDLSHAEEVESATVDLLRWAIAHNDDTGSGAGPVHILVPDED
ncbi:hypothetical protein FDF08_03725 [Micrococcus luteus]|nr:hypothetical protein FDF08_03725 [Micrococcus luteus]